MNDELKKLLAIAAILLPLAASAQTDTTVVIGETGYLPLKASKPFTGPANLLICTTNASNNAKTKDLTYYTYRADTCVAMATCYVLIGKPGTYTLTYQETATLRGSSNLSWTDESIYTDTRFQTDSEKQRRVYKFINTKEKIGFQRDENYASENYKTCAFGEGEHLYISLPSNVADKVAINNGKTGRDDLDFIAWHGMTPDDITTGLTPQTSNLKSQTSNLYDLQGRAVGTNLQKGVYISNGKKYIKKK